MVGPIERPDLQDQFAMAALTGIVASSFSSDLTEQEAAEYAYRYAAAMLVERER